MAPVTLHRLEDGGADELEPYRTLRLRRDLRQGPLFVAEGDKVVARLLASDHVVVSVLATARALERVRPLLDARAEPIRAFVAAEKRDVDAWTGFRSEDVKAVGRVPRPRSVAELARPHPSPALLVALDGLSNAENVGGVVRNAAALGAHGIVVGPSTCSPYLTRAIRTSMGAVFGIGVAEVDDLAAALRALSASGVRTVATDLSGGALSLSDPEPAPALDALLGGDVCVVLGAEGEGISAPVREACDARVAVPMAAGVDSLNVASAAAIVLHEVRRRRRT